MKIKKIIALLSIFLLCLIAVQASVTASELEKITGKIIGIKYSYRDMDGQLVIRGFTVRDASGNEIKINCVLKDGASMQSLEQMYLSNETVIVTYIVPEYELVSIERLKDPKIEIKATFKNLGIDTIIDDSITDKFEHIAIS